MNDFPVPTGFQTPYTAGNPRTFGFFLSWFDCSEDISGTGQFTMTNIIQSTASFVDGRVCWGAAVGLDTFYSSCNIHWVVGMNTQLSLADHDVKFTYSLHVIRGCN